MDRKNLIMELDSVLEMISKELERAKVNLFKDDGTNGVFRTSFQKIETNPLYQFNSEANFHGVI